MNFQDAIITRYLEQNENDLLDIFVLPIKFSVYVIKGILELSIKAITLLFNSTVKVVNKLVEPPPPPKLIKKI